MIPNARAICLLLGIVAGAGLAVVLVIAGQASASGSGWRSRHVAASGKLWRNVR